MSDVLMTNYELAYWLASGKGQKQNSPNAQIRMYHNYFPEQEDMEVDDGIRIRPFGCKRWLLPTVKHLYE